MPMSFPTGSARRIPQKTGESPSPAEGITTSAAVKANSGRITALTQGSIACRVDERGRLRHREAEQDTGDRRVHARQQDERPRRAGEDDQRGDDPPATADVQQAAQDAEQHRRQEAGGQHPEIQIRREQHRDEHDARPRRR